MVALIAVVLAAGLLYFWLLGHWFARVLVFAPFVIGGVAMIIGGLNDHVSGHLIPLGALFGAMGWCIGSAPIWYYRHQEATSIEARKALIPYPTQGS